MTATLTRPTSDRLAADALLRVQADSLNDIEGLRIAQENRYRTLTNTWEHTNDDGEIVTYGLGLPVDLPQVQDVAAQIDRLIDEERSATRTLERAMKQHYLGPWVQEAHGIGLKQGARMIAAIGDPADRDNVRQLYAYCGLHVVAHPDNPEVGIAPFHQRGQQSNWNGQAHARFHVIAESCIKQIGPVVDDDGNKIGGTNRRSPYRDVYDDAREKYDFANHQAPCRRCGPSGSPAPTGSPLSDGHQHARALRLVKKAILKDLWREARRLARGE